MVTEQSSRMQQVIKVARVRKQRLANAATEARRKLATAEDERANAAERVRLAQAALYDAGKLLLQNPASEQMLIWRDHISAQKAGRVAEKAQSEDVCVEAQDRLSQSLKALVRQDVRNDHLTGESKQLRHRLMRLQEARIDDEAQGSGQQNRRVLR